MTRSASPARTRILRSALTFTLAAIAAMALAVSASAAPAVDGPFTLYSVDDVCHIDLTPETAALTTGATHTVTATVTSTPIPEPALTDVASLGDVIEGCYFGAIAALEGTDVKFTVTSGPNAGKSGVVQLDATGKASFSYVGTADGTDSIAASIELPDICFAIYNGQQPSALDSCDDFAFPEGVPSLAVNCFPQNAAVEEPLPCPMVTLTDTATATWTSPAVQAEADPRVSIATANRCVSRKLTVRPSYTGGTIKSSTLFIDSRKVKTKTGSGSFVINTSKYKGGRHHLEIVTVFSNGKSASKFGSFTRCKVRTAARKVTPQFTG